MSNIKDGMELIELIEEHEDELTNWERGFVDSMRVQLEADEPFIQNRNLKSSNASATASHRKDSHERTRTNGQRTIQAQRLQ